MIDSARKVVELIDVGRKEQSEVTFHALDQSLEKLKASLRGTVEALEKSGGRANILEAAMTRDLFETPLKVEVGENPRRWRLTNHSAEVVADGVPEATTPGSWEWSP